MYYTTHLVTGAAVGSMMTGSALPFLAGLGTHLLLDAIPHHDYYGLPWVLTDLLLGSLGLFWLLSQTTVPLPVFWGALGGALPDLELGVSHLFRRRLKIFPSHTGKTPHGRWPLPGGLLLQIGWVAILWTWLLNLP